MTPHDQPTEEITVAFEKRSPFHGTFAQTGTTAAARYRTAPTPDARVPVGFGGHSVGVLAVTCLLLGAASGAGASVAVTHLLDTSAGGSNAGGAHTTPVEQVVVDDVSSQTVRVVQEVGAAVVSIRNDQQPRQDLVGAPNQPVSAGSGVVIDKHGYILTNYHVVADAQALIVTFANATTARATIVGSDPSNDIAVIKVKVPVPAVAQFGDSNQIKTGETVIAIGDALGNLQNTVTEGIVSGLHRSLPSADDASGQESLENLIQTDAAINRGNSGGPLVDLAGHVIGINTAVVRSTSSAGITDPAEGLGFAIPANTARMIADRLIFHTPAPSLGIRYLQVSPQLASAYGLPVGAQVRSVVPGSPAARAGLRPQDIITAVNGQQMDGTRDLKMLIETFAVGDTVRCTVFRAGQTLTMRVTLGKSAM
jgi:S1-C subfamily serine protease